MSYTDFSSIDFEHALTAALTIPAVEAVDYVPIVPLPEATNPQAGQLQEVLRDSMELGAKILLVDAGLHTATVAAIRALKHDEKELLEVNLGEVDGSLRLEFVLEDEAFQVLWTLAPEVWAGGHAHTSQSALFMQALRVRLNRFMESIQAIGWVSVRTWFNYDENNAAIVLESVEDRAHAIMLNRMSIIQAEMMNMMTDAATSGNDALSAMQSTATNKIYSALRDHFNEQVRLNAALGIYEVAVEDH